MPLLNRPRAAIFALLVTGASSGCSRRQAPDAQTGGPDPASPSATEPNAAPSGAATRDRPTSTATAAAPTDSIAPASSEAPRASLGGEIVALPVVGFRDAVVSVPTGAVSARPVVLALHGNFDRPEWQCEVWRGITRAQAFVLCPRGIPRPDAPRSLDRWTYGNGGAVRAEIEAALTALRARFGSYVGDGPLLYTGFSLGAIHGVGVVAAEGGRFPRAVLVEGGHDGWTAARAKSYRAAGGKRVLFACGQRACKAGAIGAEKRLAREGIETRIVYGSEVGHTYDGPVAAEVARAWSWLVAGDPLWTDDPAGNGASEK